MANAFVGSDNNGLVSTLDRDLERRAVRLAADRESGASELLTEVIAILSEALVNRVPVRPLARAMCEAQPSMASVWNASLEALASERSAGRFERFARRVARSAEALRRFSLECFLVEPAGPADLKTDAPPLQLITLSFSRSVVTVIEALSALRQVAVFCSESRPGLEGRRLATGLSAHSLHVTCFADAAIAHALGDADAVLVGADAIAPEWFVNKSGTRMLAAAASSQGVPVYVAATRDKFVTRALASHLRFRDGAAAEVWDAPPSGVTVRNPYFEATPLDLVTAVISDVGALGATVVPDVCESASDPLLTEALNQLGGVG